MMTTPYTELPITSTSSATISAIHMFADELLSHGSDTRVIFDAIKFDGECGLAHAYAAALHLTAMTRAGQAEATRPLALALAFHDNCNLREQQTIAAIAAWGIGDDRLAVAIFRQIVESWPHDLVAAKLCQILELSQGDIDGMVRTSAMAAAVEGRAGYALGLHGFALEQAGETELAMRYARRALDLSPNRDPWAQHTVAHVFAAREQPIEGRAFLHAHATDWDRCSSFMLTHNWWHLALFELELGNASGALGLFDERVWSVRKEHCQDQVNAISLLARLEMEGVDAGWRWEDIAQYVKGQSDDAINPLLDLHYLYALARAGHDEAVARMLERLDPASVHGAVAHGIAAFSKGQNLLAASAIAPVCRSLHELGGSNVQRDLFGQIFYESVMRCRQTQCTHASSTFGSVREAV